MSWAVGYDQNWQRDIGYGVPATCDYPGCGERIDRGLSYVCGGQPYGGEDGCGLYFCKVHAPADTCERCADGPTETPFEPTPDLPEWIAHKLTDDSWAEWRADNPEEVARLRGEATVADIEAMRSDLTRAGWVEERTYIWRAPNGALFLGPAGAWRALKRAPSVLDARDRADGRAALIQRAMRLRVEIEQIFTDCASWNENARQPHEAAIDCDPDGKLRRVADGIDRMLAKEANRG